MEKLPDENRNSLNVSAQLYHMVILKLTKDSCKNKRTKCRKLYVHQTPNKSNTDTGLKSHVKVRWRSTTLKDDV